MKNVTPITDGHTVRANRAFDEATLAAQKRRQHEMGEARRAHAILQDLFVAQGHLPNNLYMAMTHLHIEIVARSTPAKEAACTPNN